MKSSQTQPGLVSSFFSDSDTTDILIPSGGADGSVPKSLPGIGAIITSAVVTSSTRAPAEVPGFYIIPPDASDAVGSSARGSRRASSAMAAQLVPRARLVNADSISGWAAAMFSQLTGFETAEDETSASRILVHVVPYSKSRDAMQRRCRLIDVEFQQLLQKKRRSMARRLIQTEETPFDRPILLLQAILLSPSEGWISVCLTDASLPSVFPLGVTPEVIDKRPPSRAYLKLLEAEHHLWDRIAFGETCVDLGGSPGGWTWIARDRKASVIAVDRTELAPSLMADPGVEFVKGDALKYLPAQPVDWLLCDVICAPDVSLALLTNWAMSGSCRKFVVTLKFKGEPDWQTIAHAQDFIASNTLKGYVRRLSSNKNEVTIAGVLSR